MTYSRIVGTGSYLPEKILTNKDLESIVDTSSDWIIERTGIERRHVAAENETTASMATEAARKAIEAAGIDPSEIDLIIGATCTPERVFPSTACLLQERLNIGPAIAFDVTAACAGFLYAVSIADQYIRGGNAKKVLIVGAEVLTRGVDWTDRATCVLFGDGAGAVILSASDEPGIHSTHLHADGKYKDILYYPNNKFAPHLADGRESFHMSGREVFKVAVRALGEAAEEALTANNIDHSQIDWLIPHQANLRIISATAKKLKLSMDKVILTVADHANTSAASIPLALDYGVQQGLVKPGHKLLLEAIGGGMTWGSALVTF